MSGPWSSDFSLDFGPLGSVGGVAGNSASTAGGVSTVAGPNMTFYRQDTQSLTHDASGLFTPVRQLDRWINSGRRDCARRTGCVRRLISGQSAFGASAQSGAIIPGGMQPGALPGTTDNAAITNTSASVNTFKTIAGLERYSYEFFNPYLRAQYAGVKGIMDVISMSVSWGGSVRPSLDWLPWDVLQARARAYANLVTSYPFFWSIMNDGEMGEVWLFPVPSFQMEMEADVFAVPLDLTNENDFDVIPDGFKNAIKYYAAGLSMYSMQRYMNGKLYMDMYADALGISRFAAESGKSVSYYPRVF